MEGTAQTQAARRRRPGQRADDLSSARRSKRRRAACDSVMRVNARRRPDGAGWLGVDEAVPLRRVGHWPAVAPASGGAPSRLPPTWRRLDQVFDGDSSRRFATPCDWRRVERLARRLASMASHRPRRSPPVALSIPCGFVWTLPESRAARWFNPCSRRPLCPAAPYLASARPWLVAARAACLATANPQLTAHRFGNLGLRMKRASGAVLKDKLVWRAVSGLALAVDSSDEGGGREFAQRQRSIPKKKQPSTRSTSWSGRRAIEF